MIAPDFYLVVILFSADMYFTSPCVVSPVPYAECFVSDEMVTNTEDILLANIISQNNIVIALPIYDEDFAEKLNEVVISFKDYNRNDGLLENAFDFEDSVGIDKDYYLHGEELFLNGEEIGSDDEFDITEEEYMNTYETCGLDTTITS